jgi:hypothetical protein
VLGADEEQVSRLVTRFPPAAVIRSACEWVPTFIDALRTNVGPHDGPALTTLVDRLVAHALIAALSLRFGDSKVPTSGATARTR